MECIIIHRKSNFSVYWDILMGLLCIYSAFFYAYASLFDVQDFENVGLQTAEMKQDIFFFVMFTFDILK